MSRIVLSAALLLAACSGEDDEVVDILGMPLLEDGVTYAGVAVIDVTPSIVETYTDLNDNHTFDGCLDDPTASRDGCDEPFDDANGNGVFEPVWIGGFGPLRPAQGVHDPVYARALVIAEDGEYQAFVALDFVGLMFPRIHEARDALAADGFDPDHLLVSSSHNHQGPDTMGLWGNPYNLASPTSGLDRNYQSFIADAIEEAVREAAGSMVPVQLTVGAENLRDLDPLFNGSDWGGHSPDAIQHGLVHDGRDPVVVSDQLLVLHGAHAETGEGVFTLTNWSGHPEVWGSEQSLISSDWVGVTRTALEAELGGVALHLPECLGGMQSALGGDMPLVDDAGERIWRSCDAVSVADANDEACFGKLPGDDAVFADGVREPVWAEHTSWDFVRSHGHAIADSALGILERGEPMQASPLRVEVQDIDVPIANVAYKLLGPSGVFEADFTDLVEDTERCPEAADDDACLTTRTFRLQIGDIGLSAVPGELLPELAWGFPEDDPRWADEASDTTARGRDASARYFVQHPRACDATDYEACRETDGSIDGCDCLRMHAVPYRLSDEDLPPILAHHDTRYRAAVSMADNYLSYIIPEPDVNLDVSLLSDGDGDHYEDTVSPSAAFGTRVLRAHQEMADRW